MLIILAPFSNTELNRNFWRLEKHKTTYIILKLLTLPTLLSYII